MNDDYLWDRSGPVDPQVARLEQALERFRLEPRVPRQAPPRAARRVWPRLLPLATAAAALATLAWVLREDRPEPGYDVEALAGSLLVEDGRGDGRLRAGDALETDQRSRVRLGVAELGSLVLEPGTRLRVERPEDGAAGAEHPFFLERGTVVASIFAAPRAFQVGTPAGIAVDLGCIYTTTVEADGSTRLAVLSGQVSFEAHERRWVRASRSGIFHPRIELGERVTRGQSLGFLADPLMHKRRTVRASLTGMVIGFTRNPLVHQGDALVHLARI